MTIIIFSQDMLNLTKKTKQIPVKLFYFSRVIIAHYRNKTHYSNGTQRHNNRRYQWQKVSSNGKRQANYVI